jgi:O-antigen/teichoic acid export membrane protein
LHQEGAVAMQRVLWSAARFSAPVFVVYVLVVLLGGPWIVGLVFGESYLEHVDALRVFAIGELVWFPVTVLRLELAARKLQRYLLWAEIWSVVVVYGLGILLINSLGLVGAAIAHLIVNLGALVLTVAVVHRERRRDSYALAAPHGLGEAARSD